MDQKRCQLKQLIEKTYDCIYSDLEDTLLMKSGEESPKLNYKLIAFLCKSLNEGKDLYLITKVKGSNKDLKKELKENYLNGLFSFKRDNVIHIGNNDHKHDYMKPNSILIDDNEFERVDASSNGFPAISPDDVGLLM